MVAIERITRGLGRLILATAILAGSAGCTTWKHPPEGLASLGRGPHSARTVRVTLADGQQLVFNNAYIQGDSLVGAAGRGVLADGSGEFAPWTRSAVPLPDVRGVEIREVSAGKTLLLVTVIGIGATVAIVAAASSGVNDAARKSPPPPSSSDGCFMCSCPLLYSWDGHDWRLDSGTFGGAFLKPLAYTDHDNLEALRPDRGVARLKLQAGEGETDHIDELAILAVDHDPRVSVAIDPGGGVHTVEAPQPPLAARDDSGRDALPLVARADGRSWETSVAIRDTSEASKLRDGVVLDFARPRGSASAKLVLRANKTAWAAYLMRSFVRAHGSAVSSWYGRMESDPAAAGAFRHLLEREVHLNAYLWEHQRWVPVASVWGGGPEIAKTHAIPIDLSRVSGDRVRVRLESAPSFWLVDQAALDASMDRPVIVRGLVPSSATTADGRDVRRALRASDGIDLVIENGEEVAITLPVPEPTPGTARTFLSRVSGWYRFHTPETGPADAALLSSVLARPQGISRTSVAWMNEAIHALHTGD